MNVRCLALCGFAFLAEIAIQIIGADWMADIAIRVRGRGARDQAQLFPHFGEAGAAILSVQVVEDGGHDPPPSFDYSHAIISPGGDT